MENEPPPSQSEDARSTRRGRLMGKLFGAKERKPAAEEETGTDVNDFLNGPSDTLQVSHATPSTALPLLAKLDISSATRYPQALPVGNPSQQNLNLRPDSRLSANSYRRNRKGLVVRFVDTYPEIIGEGGDESEIPTFEISRRRKARPPPPPSPRRKPLPSHDHPPNPPPEPPRQDGDFAPSPLRRTQTGYSVTSDPPQDAQQDAQPTVLPGRATSTRFLDTSRAKDENRRSFIEIHQAEMREAEGKAFAEAARSAGPSPPPQQDWAERNHSSPPTSVQSHESPKFTPQRTYTPESITRKPALEQSPSSLYSNNSGFGQQVNQFSRQASMNSQNTFISSSAATSRQASLNIHDVVVAAGDDALNTFISRTRHLFELFRLHAETVKPVSACTTNELARAMLWWFLKGRMALEVAIRERPGSPQAQMQNEMDRQQAYANLAKGYWLSEEAIPEIMENKQLQPDYQIEDVRRNLVSTLTKLAISMKRNGYLPPEEPFLPQHIDKSIWLEYPRLNQDIIALLTGNAGSALSGDARQGSMQILDSLPLGDTTENFNFGRVSADAFLMEQGMDSQRFYFPCLLSMIRPQKQPNLVFVLASQNGAVQLRIQGNKNIGPTWDDVRWRNESCTLDIKLPRGFMLAVQCSQQDYRMLWSMFDFGSKVQSTLYPRNDESVAFRSTLRNFQYFDSDPQSRAFPKDAVPFCDVALFEKVLKEAAAAGPRTYHRGFRIVVVTGPRTRTLSGVNHSYAPQQPVQFGFLRGERGDPALLLKFDNGREKGSMVLSFNDENERVQFHSLLIGTALHHDEKVFADVPLVGFSIFRTLTDAQSLPGFRKLPWKSARVINDEHGGDDNPSTVLSDKLRVVVDFQNGSITDRVNVAPGELRMRLEVENAKCLVLMRHAQEDMTIALSEAQVSRELPKDMAESLQTMVTSQSIRFYKFPGLKELHAFQAALTGFTVVFDALASAFAISRRRMVVPIHKKWDAGWSRIQVVQQDRVIQLLAFFPEFNHGQCMNFVLKGTDVFETFNRSGKAGLKIVDAKFPMPRMPREGDSPSDDMGFVSLDLPDLPGEHDDISIVFENESDRDRLCQCLPAPVKGSSRLSRVK